MKTKDGFLSWVRERKSMGWSMSDKLENLPDGMPPLPLSIDRERLCRFKNDYALVAEFAALVCGTTVEKLCALDMMKYLMEKKYETKD